MSYRMQQKYFSREDMTAPACGNCPNAIADPQGSVTAKGFFMVKCQPLRSTHPCYMTCDKHPKSDAMLEKLRGIA